MIVWLGVSVLLYMTARPQTVSWNVEHDWQIGHRSGFLTANAVHTHLVGLTTADGSFLDFDCYPEGKHRDCEIPGLVVGKAERSATIWYVTRPKGFLDGHSRRLLVRLQTEDGQVDYDHRSYLKRYRAAAATEPDYNGLFYWTFVVGMMILIAATRGFAGTAEIAR